MPLKPIKPRKVSGGMYSYLPGQSPEEQSEMNIAKLATTMHTLFVDTIHSINNTKPTNDDYVTNQNKFVTDITQQMKGIERLNIERLNTMQQQITQDTQKDILISEKRIMRHIDELRTDMSEMKKDMNELKKDMNELKKDMKELRDFMYDSMKDMMQIVERFDTRVTRIENAIGIPVQGGKTIKRKTK